MLNSFFADCKYFEPGQRGVFTFKRPFPNQEVFLQTLNNFELSATQNGQFVMRKLRTEGLASPTGVEFDLGNEKDWVPSVCVLVCDNCQTKR